ncbi:hypothetical protein GTP38_00590 [Duganella sp. FT94W]|uniref:ABC transporter permease n=1 Tax=Duganella lactea TaxID=2692173 RepID=A0ABW9UZB2_9BURK|nr:hypothetical protein [Duganella lactea]MYM32846.1 hypothetical protein [Duganella lactea]
MNTSYLRFRLRLARHALLQFAVSLRSSLEYILLGFAPVIFGLFACVALPGLFAATQPWPQALGWLAGQVLLASAPVWLLRKRLLPAAVLLWSRPLPVPARLRWLADAAVAGMIVGPLSIAYLVSCAIWLYQWPDWLSPVVPQALLLTLASLLLAWLLSTLALAHRARIPNASPPRRRRPAPAAYTPSRTVAYVDPPHPAPPASASRPTTVAGTGTHLPYFWKQLFWLPFWRAENVVGIQQTLLLAGAFASIGVWLWHPPIVPPALWGACAALTTMLLTDRGDKAVAEQITLLRPVAVGWPLNVERLYRLAMLFTLLPASCVLAWFAALTLGRNANGYSHTVAIVWLCFAALAQIAVVALRRLSTRGRVGLVIGAIIILTAIGSELWN